ncbi:nitroreductase family protein [Exiguobacterium sp. RIT341]|uniref:nitroreductase family protein n=1 Tax=Exiguobacterium sp. RIT341 TaxID=1470592 RepID=UPI00044D10D9|nr:nitroreductase family protein [Exiguobacterium sp. RIT341]EZP58941.1 NAD(P)H nitroreductase [Exiguobacterium sp. RIT341]
MTTQTTTDFMEIVKGRRSIRNYDTNVKISKEEMTQILEEATLAPSSVNMQPWRFLVIDSEEGKATLAPLAKFNQVQVETSSAVIAVFGDMNAVDINSRQSTIWLLKKVSCHKKYAIAKYQPSKVSTVQKTLKHSILIDSGLVSMQLMLVARAHGYDTNPIGGYEKDQIAEAFGLEKERYLPVMLLSIGKAVDAGYPSVRLPIADIAEWK